MEIRKEIKLTIPEAELIRTFLKEIYYQGYYYEKIDDQLTTYYEDNADFPHDPDTDEDLIILYL